jgi:spore coat polysaccharide biosynthesis predicted glycosyltransferase SpsG
VIKELFGSDTRFLMRDYSEGVAFARDVGEQVIVLDSSENMSEMEACHIIAAESPDWTVVDLPYSDLDMSFVSKIKSLGSKVVFIDDCRFVNPGADVLINSSILAPDKMTYKPNGDTNMFLGPEYLILDETLTMTKPIKTEGMFNFLLSFGGSDPTKLTEKVVKAIAESFYFHRTRFQIILGPGYPNESTISRLVANRDEFDLVVCPSEIYPFFLGSDLIVCAGGRTIYELFAMRKLFFPIATNDHEAEAINAFIQQGLIGFGLTEWNPEKFIYHLNQILKTNLVKLNYIRIEGTQ